MKAATYSRYSSDNQRETSIEDQQRLQGARAAQENWSIVAAFADYEISASTPMAFRDGGKKLIDAAAAREFDVLLIEGLDRCWRDIVDQEQTIRRLEYQGIRIIGVSDGYDTRHEDRELQRGVRGILNQQYLRDLAKKTHRGLTGQVFRGGFAGGLSYGYRSVDAGAIHRLEIDPDQARWVRWIFERYGEDGWSCQRIAAELNRQGVKTGRGGTWAVSALYGSPNKGSGVLNNELYVGRYIWNRSQWVKEPDTGKRVRLVRPVKDWIVEDRPELRILTDDQWQTVRARMGGTRLANGSKGKGARPKTLLGGLMRCGKCGGPVIAVSKYEYGCAARKDRGDAVCQGVRINRTQMDLRMVSAMREDLVDQTAIIELRQRVDGILTGLIKTSGKSSAATRAALNEIEGEIGRLVDAVVATGHSDAIVQRLKAAEGKRDELRRQLAPAITPAALKIDDLMARYRRQLAMLQSDLEKDTERARTALAAHFGEIVIEEDPDSAWACFTTSPDRLLLKAVGDSGMGCGGAICDPEPRRIRLR